MQNVGIYHIAAQLCSQPNSAVVFPGALPLDPAGANIVILNGLNADPSITINGSNIRMLKAIYKYPSIAGVAANRTQLHPLQTFLTRPHKLSIRY